MFSSPKFYLLLTLLLVSATGCGSEKKTADKMPHYYLAADTLERSFPEVGIGEVRIKWDGHLDRPALVRLPFVPIKGRKVELIELDIAGFAPAFGGMRGVSCVVIADSTKVWENPPPLKAVVVPKINKKYVFSDRDFEKYRYWKPARADTDSTTDRR